MRKERKVTPKRENIFSIRIESKKESVMYAVALGCVLFLIIGVTWLYWSQSANRIAERESFDQSQNLSMLQKETMVGRTAYDNAISENSSMWFFGILIVSLILIVGLTFRYYSHREMKETEKRWRIACQSFVTRMEIEQIKYEENRGNRDTAWEEILKGESVDTSEIVGIADRRWSEPRCTLSLRRSV